jgi:hypothetical protein
MSIGRAGKRAERLGQQRQRRHAVTYSASEAAPPELKPPVRRKPVARQPVTGPEPLPTAEARPVQRADTSPPAETLVGGDTGPAEQAPTGNRQVSPTAVAEKVYAMFQRDMKLERERFGSQSDRRRRL